MASKRLDFPEAFVPAITVNAPSFNPKFVKVLKPLISIRVNMASF